MTQPRNRIKALREVRAGDLLADDRNWRHHPPAQVQALREMLERIGYAGALLARETPDGLRLVDGHLRASLDADAMVPVLVLDIDEAEAGQLLATIDPISAMATANVEKLQALADSLKVPVPLDLKGLYPGIRQYEPHDGGVVGDHGPAVEPGQLWQLGSHRLMCGDSTDDNHVAQLLNGAAPRLMITDPPYGVEYDPLWRARRGKVANHRYMDAFDDTKQVWQSVWLSSPAVVAYVWQSQVRLTDVGHELRDAGYQLRRIITWVKTAPTITRGPYMGDTEVAWYAVREGESAHWIGPLSAPTIINATRPIGKDRATRHATEKPVACMEIPMSYHRGDVYEPFCGSGTTLIAAENQGRACYAMEIKPEFCSMAIARWEAHTDQTAKMMESE